MALNLYDPYGVTAQEEVASNKPRMRQPLEKARKNLTVPINAFMPEEEKKTRVPQTKNLFQSHQYFLNQNQAQEGPQGSSSSAAMPLSEGNFQGSGVSQAGGINNPFGAYNPADKYSGGINYGVDIGVPKGTKLYAPPGDWVVVSAFNKATAEGPSNRQGGINSGYGNSVLLQNPKTGEKLRLSHLRPGGVAVKPGMKVTQGDFIGESGATGNVAGRTGQHLDLEYYNQKGQLADPMRTPYGKYYTGG